MASIVDGGVVDLRSQLSELARSGLPFSPVDGMGFTGGANLERFQKSMRSFGWLDPRFVTETQAADNGWTIKPDANFVMARVIDSGSGLVEAVALFNAETVRGMPSLNSMLAMSDGDLAKIQGRSAMAYGAEDALGASPARAADRARERVEYVQSLLSQKESLLDAGSLDVDGNDVLVIGPSREVEVAGGLGAGISGAGDVGLDALYESFLSNDFKSNDVHFNAIKESYRGSMNVPSDGVDVELAASLVASDIADLQMIVDPSLRHFAAVFMGTIAAGQVSYRDELLRQSPVVALEVDVAVRENDRRVSERDVRELQAEVEVPSPAVDETAPAPRFAAMAPYWLNGLHNFDGLALAEKINRTIREKKLAEHKDVISQMFVLYPDARRLGVGIVNEDRYLSDRDLKVNPGEPGALLGGALLRDKEGAYRPAGAGGFAVLQDNGDHLVLKKRSSEAYRGAMELAAAKGWKNIELKGKPAMLSDAWLEAKMMGLNVVNYSPNEKDLANFEARVVKEAQRKAMENSKTMQTDERVEVRPFVDANGVSKEAQIKYTVSYQGGIPATFDNAKDAAKAFLSVPRLGSPVVVRSVTRVNGLVDEGVVAGSTNGVGLRGVVNSADVVVDAEFDEAAASVIEDEKALSSFGPGRVVVEVGGFSGKIMAIEGNLFSQKTGLDPNVVVWHDASKIPGFVPKIGAVVNVGYAKGVGTFKVKGAAKDLGDEGGKGLGR